MFLASFHEAPLSASSEFRFVHNPHIEPLQKQQSNGTRAKYHLLFKRHVSSSTKARAVADHLPHTCVYCVRNDLPIDPNYLQREGPQVPLLNAGYESPSYVSGLKVFHTSVNKNDVNAVFSNLVEKLKVLTRLVANDELACVP